MSEPSQPVTSWAVAEAAGVSQSAVSRAFTPGGRIAPETRARILSLANEMGYVPRTLLRVSGRADPPSIAVVTTDISNPFLPQVLERLTRSLRARGCTMQLHCIPRGETVDSVVPDLFRQPVSGVLIASATLSSQLARICRERGLAVVLLNRAVPSPDVNMVGCDNYAGGRQVAELLLRTGRERIAFIGGREEIGSNNERERGLVDGLALQGQALFAKEMGDFEYEAAFRATERLLSAKVRPDAIFCANDLMALGAVDAAMRKLDRRVPEEVSIVGYDDIPMASWPAYDLTTIRQRLDVTIEEALDLLQRVMENPESVGLSRLVMGSLVERGTTLPTSDRSKERPST